MGRREHRRVQDEFFYEDEEPPLIDVAPVALPNPQTNRVFRASREDWAVLSSPAYEKGKYVDVDTAQQLLVLYDEGRVVSAFEISSGKRGYETPAGTFRVLSKHDNHWSATYGLWMPYSLNFTGGISFTNCRTGPADIAKGKPILGREFLTGASVLESEPQRRCMILRTWEPWYTFIRFIYVRIQ